MSAANICLLGIHPLIITLKSISLMIILKLRSYSSIVSIYFYCFNLNKNFLTTD
ncbi:hypothetical protein SNSL254_A3263 [Salmonella enterica subsp. enterica serovar Newport str. SL254]|uniref:Uncharacterized protein n=1 Tax=Salmonella newport (strain SL254) TaxID=423368 RepID=A0A0H3BSE2_SALNS|nr:hypothetical protein SNSL254_A3263 [Salmonella enterica subsp. enterica serovar Newport str. SL254]